MKGENTHPDLRYLRELPVHFILCTESTGSSMLTAMLNQVPEVLCTSEQLFPLYFYRKYGKKKTWSIKEINAFVKEFILMFERNIRMFYSDPETLRKSLLLLKDDLDYQLLIRVCYYHFLDLKDKSSVSLFIDKQIAFLYFPRLIKKIFPGARILILTRDVRDNIVSRKKRKFNNSENYFYLAAIWNDTYRNTGKLAELFKGQTEILRYEDLVRDPAGQLKRACAFFGIRYSNEMLRFHETFGQFLLVKQEAVGSSFIDMVREKHGSMLRPVFTDKVGAWQADIDEETAAGVAALCLETGKTLGYDFSEPYPPAAPGPLQRARIFYARCRRYYLLRFYMQVPLGLKLFIKRIKGKKSFIT